METLYSIAVIVGLMKGYAQPPKPVVAAPVEQHQVAEIPKPRAHAKSEWRLDY